MKYFKPFLKKSILMVVNGDRGLKDCFNAYHQIVIPVSSTRVDHPSFEAAEWLNDQGIKVTRNHEQRLLVRKSIHEAHMKTERKQ